jgi:hypothetical protein
VEFFGDRLARRLAGEGKQADLIAGANVLAQVPDVNDFVKGFKILLKSRGVLTIEFPHLMRLIDENQFDTIYHEHFSYFSFLAAERDLRRSWHHPLRRRGDTHAWRLIAHIWLSYGCLPGGASSEGIEGARGAGRLQSHGGIRRLRSR